MDKADGLGPGAAPAIGGGRRRAALRLPAPLVVGRLGPLSVEGRGSRPGCGWQALLEDVGDRGVARERAALYGRLGRVVGRSRLLLLAVGLGDGVRLGHARTLPRRAPLRSGVGHEPVGVRVVASARSAGVGEPEPGCAIAIIRIRYVRNLNDTLERRVDEKLVPDLRAPLGPVGPDRARSERPGPRT